jgi:pimeloyl-ACP methyl ester carboxylesterase
MLDGLELLVDDPVDPLKALAAYLVEAHGVHNARLMAGSWARATLIPCPTLLITGTYDPFCPPSLVRDMADAIPRGEYREALEPLTIVSNDTPGHRVGGTKWRYFSWRLSARTATTWS